MMRFSFIILTCCILFGCSTQKVVERKLEVFVPAVKDTLAADTVFQEINLPDTSFMETLFQGALLREGSTGKKDTAAVAKFIPRTGNFIIDVPEYKETVIVKDTIRMKDWDYIPEGNDPTEKIIWISSFVLTTLIIIFYKRKLNK